MKRIAILPLTLAFMLAALLLTGCAGHGVDFTPYVGSYSGSVTLDNNKSGTMTVSCDAHGIMNGTFDVVGADGNDTYYKFTAGTYSLVGSITSDKGAFEVNGTVPTFGDFFIRGSLPTDGSTKSFTVITSTSTNYPNSLTYPGTLHRN